ncbi:HNH endonuclease [Halobiforma nitratireducens]|uniref:HNH endonuclease n=1 Tax=Halobiforma nitratireducens JCM 10879 TaxID=1227454 RepID=M0LY87_9EURY|nr:HNH endonuclease signature motif containing protein [Halobiforma nitratireducens]EMA38532.1 HNH endonuclease [Halobiforma nitratireducens JCM 10879]
MTRVTAERFFGGTDQRIEYLHSTLRFVSSQTPTEHDLTNWILENTPANSKLTIERNISFLESIDLLDQTPDGYQPTNKGEAFWRHDEPLVMYEGLATAVDGFREIARAIPNGHRTIDAIQDHLQQSYPDHELPTGVVSRHLEWLEALNVVTNRDGTYAIPIEDGTFEVGETYSRWFIHDVLGGERYRGISRTNDQPLLFVFTGDAGDDHGYEDEFLEDDTFLYTGEGTVGDMTMDDGNEAIRTHKQNDDTLHLFENTALPWIVTYLGQYEYVGHRRTELPDENGDLRAAFRFQLAPVGGTEVELETTPNSLSEQELFEKATQSAPTPAEHEPTATSSSTRSYPRSDIVRKFALRVADGVCQGCEEDAPFLNDHNEPFLEVHHLTRRSDGGPDAPANVIALCPNCHRRVHEGRDGDAFNRRLKAKAAARTETYR